jgi:hypothetical protein
MADPTPHEDSGAEPNHESKPTTPRWVKLSGIITVIVVLLLLVVLILAGHDPGRHATGTPWDQTPPGATDA